MCRAAFPQIDLDGNRLPQVSAFDTDEIHREAREYPVAREHAGDTQSVCVQIATVLLTGRKGAPLIDLIGRATEQLIVRGEHRRVSERVYATLHGRRSDFIARNERLDDTTLGGEFCHEWIPRFGVSHELHM